MNAAVAAGQIDAAIADTAIVLAFAKQSAGALEVAGQYKTGEQYGALYPKGSPNAAAVNQIIEQLRSDGTLDKLSQTWLGPAFGGDPAKVPYFTAPDARVVRGPAGAGHRLAGDVPETGTRRRRVRASR